MAFHPHHFPTQQVQEDVLLFFGYRQDWFIQRQGFAERFLSFFVHFSPFCQSASKLQFTHDEPRMNANARG